MNQSQDAEIMINYPFGCAFLHNDATHDSERFSYWEVANVRK